MLGIIPVTLTAGSALAVPWSGTGANTGAVRGYADAPTPTPTPTPAPTPTRPQRPVPVNCNPSIGAKSPGRGLPWAQVRLNFSEAWKFTRGKGVTVAVVDSGVSTGPQLPTRRVTQETVIGTGTADCDGHGTGVAGIIAAARQPGNPFTGVAPAAHIVSVKFTDSQNVDCTALANGIRLAANDLAKVINVSTQCFTDTPVLRAAVRYANNHHAVIVAATGNDTTSTGQGPFFPAAYSADRALFPNVLSVGAVDVNGKLTGVSDTKTHVSVVAPGQAVLTLAPGGTFKYQDGTSFAAPFVSGVAALLRAAHPTLTAAEVVSRIITTADGGTIAGTGAGMIDPLQAVTALLPAEGGAAARAPTRAVTMVSVPRPPPSDRVEGMLVASLTVGALAAAALVLVGAVVIPAGRRRGWKPGRRS